MDTFFGSGAKTSKYLQYFQPGHTDTITLKKGRDQYGKALFYAGRP